MKIILSHDVDHLYWSEHYFRDMYLPFAIYRHTKAYFQGRLNWSIYRNRMKMKGRINRLPELLNFYQANNITASFFFGMSNALRLSYNQSSASSYIKKVIDNGHEAGVHGIEYNDFSKIKKEYEDFKRISGLSDFGIRTHYLRLSGFSLAHFEKAGYNFDSSVLGIMDPFKLGNLIEIPLSLMDVSTVLNAQSNTNLEEWIQNSKAAFDEAKSRNIPVFVVNFHDLFFDKATFPVIFDWYIWLIEFIKESKFQTTTFKQFITTTD